jgi:2,3-bisphosphoglycerate-independent phosphoglycerate mutase
MWRDSPHARLKTSGRAVGLPEGQMGNSEVGHTNIGAGRLVMQDLPRIDDAIASRTISGIPAFRDLVRAALAATGTVHLMGLLSPGGVHSHQSHIAELARALADLGCTVRVHAFLDGRDTPPRSAISYMKAFFHALGPFTSAPSRSAGYVSIATISGRYYAMDRDRRWDRVAKAYAAIVDAQAPRFEGAIGAIEASYADNVTDEFVLPRVIGDFTGIRDGDALLFANFRPDRAREILTALLDTEFAGFPRARRPRFSAAAGLTEYSVMLRRFMTALFPLQDVSETIGEIFARNGLKQLRIAETEKYAHVTFFMNGGRETIFLGEDRILVPSPQVATYDLQPEMSAPELTDRLVEAVLSGQYDLIICNYANPDMVGHSGLMPAAIRAVETVDACLGRLREAVEEAGGLLLLTADHGNVEMMKDPVTREPHTAHTLCDVPIIAVLSPKTRNYAQAFRLQNGRLADVAPTLLDLLGMMIPPQMTGSSLVTRFGASPGAHA